MGAGGGQGRERVARRVLAVVLGVATLAVTGWVLTDVRTEPTTGTVRADSEVIGVWRDDGRRWQVVGFEPGQQVELAVGISHRGPLPVQLVDAGRSFRRDTASKGCGWWPDTLRVGAPGSGPEASRPLGRGIELRGDDEIVLRLAGTFRGEPDCLPDDATASRQRLDLDLRVLGLPKRSHIELHEVVSWSTQPSRAAQRLAATPVAPRVGTAP